MSAFLSRSDVAAEGLTAALNDERLAINMDVTNDGPPSTREDVIGLDLRFQYPTHTYDITACTQRLERLARRLAYTGRLRCSSRTHQHAQAGLQVPRAYGNLCGDSAPSITGASRYRKDRTRYLSQQVV